MGVMLITSKTQTKKTTKKETTNMKKVTSYKTYGEKITVFYTDTETEENGRFDIYACSPDEDETADSYETLLHEELMHEYEMYELTDPSDY
jgi:hypothetical protein